MSPARRFVLGNTIDGFRLVEKIHVGGMAVLWRVEHPDYDFPLLMKVPLLRHGESSATIVSFEVEQMIMPRLEGPHVPRFVAAGDFDKPYLVMELIAGRSLDKRIAELPLPAAEVAALGARIAIALHDIHRQHVLHLDIKPDNVLIRDDDGEAVLLDFGLSHHEQLPDLMAEEFHVPIGTGAYISPEQLHEVRSDPRSDLFALGVLLYFFATGEHPFGDPVRVSGWRRRLARPPLPPKHLRPDLPDWLQETILRCLEIDPAARHQSAAQLAFDLQHPEAVGLTERARRTRRGGMWAAASRWLGRWRLASPQTPAVSGQLARAPIVLVAVDLSPGMEALWEAMRVSVLRVLQGEPGARLACVNVIKASRLTMNEVDVGAGSPHLQRLIELKAWARPMRLPADKVTYHVFETPDPAAALLEFARANHVDHVVMGARSSSALRRYLGSVSSQVVAEAPCTVTVVRLPGANRDRSDNTSQDGHVSGTNEIPE